MLKKKKRKSIKKVKLSDKSPKTATKTAAIQHLISNTQESININSFQI